MKCHTHIFVFETLFLMLLEGKLFVTKETKASKDTWRIGYAFNLSPIFLISFSLSIKFIKYSQSAKNTAIGRQFNQAGAHFH